MTYSMDNAHFYGPLVATTTFAFLATVTTVIRFLSRIIKNAGVGIDDYLVLSALIFLYIIIALQYLIVIIGGGGRHVTDIEPSALTKTLKMLLPIEIMYSLALAAVKTGILSFYLRLFGARRSFRKLTYTVMIVVILWLLSIIFETFLLCRPFARNWDLTIKEGSCGDRPTVYFSAGVLNIITDFMVLLLPIYEIWRLQLNKKRKWGLIIMFSFGILVSSISIVRVKSVQAIKFDDATYYLSIAIMWSLMEVALAIMIANLPMFRPFLMVVRAKWSTHSEPSTIDLEAIKRPKIYRMTGEGSLPLTSEDRAATTSDVVVFDSRRPQPSFFHHNNTQITGSDSEYLSEGGHRGIHVENSWRVEG